MATPHQVSMYGLREFPWVRAGDRLSELIPQAIQRNGLTLESDDVVVVAQKIVSKAEGRLVKLSGVEPTREALDVARRSNKDPRLVQLILQESGSLLRVVPGLVVAVHRRGWVLANAGIDQSNLEDNADGEWALLLPEDPDASAQRLRFELWETCGVEAGVIVNDTFGRPWREGVTGTAIGVAGWPALIDRRGARDLFDRPMSQTVVAHADELAAAASFVQGQADEGRPVVLIRGVRPRSPNGSGRDLVRRPEQDLFR
ncbi:coenzyme F420-0 gamma-glutamyl ligase [Panacagrimonas perspica]|uniref:Coenzyme F420-0 gamma-glutamyl ligase n=1 Tax=Panacagrimonas perspica TaxID=381431 RepID=A0A4R7NT05_9GAMM|nr:coenzyme F420-0:L-glutamate ligase [Panacagrimonas perspica]TDU24204.1 coenzyme F420-0 gamma-glutamyl ligase [Panacagrimonas perspica]THD04615.1 coenzyme F420-0:L-glutamate ligase [Panacagrimonas perspica]